MNAYLDSILGPISTYIPSAVGALIILIVGWLIALIVSGMVRRLLRKTNLDERLSAWLSGGKAGEHAEAAHWISKGVFYLIMLFVLVAFFQALQLTIITEPLNGLLNQIFDFAPRLLGAGVLTLVAWAVATLLRLIITKSLTAMNLDQRLSSQSGHEGEEIPLSKSLAEVVYWFVLLLFLPAILTALALEGLLLPIQEMINKILGFMPNILTAAAILLSGWFVAGIVQKIATNILAAIGTDRLSERVGLSAALGKQNLSGVLGLIVYIFILIPVVISALNALALEAITTPASNMLSLILEAIPSIFAAILILTLSYIVGKLISGLVSNLLAGIGFDNILVKLGLSQQTETKNSPSGIVGSVVLIAIMIFAFTEAFNLLGFEALSGLSAQFIQFGGRIILGLIIFGAGLYLANLVANAIQNSAASNANLLALSGRVAILILAGAMALRQMGLANEIINLAFGLLLGAVAVALAISFGIGGRELAARKLDEWSKGLSEEK